MTTRDQMWQWLAPERSPTGLITTTSLWRGPQRRHRGQVGYDVDKFGEQHLKYLDAGQHVEWII